MWATKIAGACIAPLSLLGFRSQPGCVIIPLWRQRHQEFSVGLAGVAAAPRVPIQAMQTYHTRLQVARTALHAMESSIFAGPGGLIWDGVFEVGAG